MRTIIAVILALSACATSDPTPDDSWHPADEHDRILVDRLSRYLTTVSGVGGPINPVCSDDGGTCCTFSDGSWCCCSFTLGCRCHIATP
jgi:hypothetical protein